MFSIAIIHAPWATERAELVAAILRVLPAAAVIRDDDRIGDLRIANRRGCWPMARRAWCSSSAIATHHLVLEDDAILCARFPELAAAAIAERPDAAISLFRGARSCSVATILPTSVIARWLAWADLEARIRPHHDQLLDLGLAALGVAHVCTAPSLVEHARTDSLLAHEHVTAECFDPGARSFTLAAKVT